MVLRWQLLEIDKSEFGVLEISATVGWSVVNSCHWSNWQWLIWLLLHRVFTEVVGGVVRRRDKRGEYYNTNNFWKWNDFQGSYICGNCKEGFTGNQSVGCHSRPGICPDGTLCDENADCELLLGRGRYQCRVKDECCDDWSRRIHFVQECQI